MTPKNCLLRSIGFAFAIALSFLFLVVPKFVRAQNSYPASGDALIHGLTIGTGAGSGVNYNTALGASALAANSGGFSNVAVGNGAMNYNTNGYWNVAVGTSALSRNSIGGGNTATGFAALDYNSTGSNNSAHGSQAMEYNTSGGFNTAIGNTALLWNTTGSSNTALGFGALAQNNIGYSNVAIGINTLQNNYGGGSNLVAVGDSSQLLNYGGAQNTSVGSKTLMHTSTGAANTVVGFQGLYTNTGGESNNGVGVQALYNNSTGWYNTGLGSLAIWSNTSGWYNTSTGDFSLYSNSTGWYNTAVGVYSLYSLTTGNYNTGVGEWANVNAAVYNSTAIGASATATASNTVAIGSSSVTSIGGYANWTNFSDGRYKKNIIHNVPGLVFINKLAPVTYTLDIDGIETRLHRGVKPVKGPDGVTPPNPMDDPVMKQAISDKKQVVYTGFVAQDVYEAAKSVGYNFSGVDKPKDDQQSFYGLRYGDFVVPLVKAVQELSAQVDSLQAANASLNNRLTQVEQVLGIQPAAVNGTATATLTSAQLFQNAPNPSGQSTLINYYLPDNSGTAILQVTGINGQIIKSIILSGNGSGQVNLQTGLLAAGTYVYSLYVNGTLVDTKKMVVVK